MDFDWGQLELFLIDVIEGSEDDMIYKKLILDKYCRKGPEM